MLDFTDDLLMLVDSPATRADIVPTYAEAVLLENFARPQQAQTLWREVNIAIAERWSWAAVDWIKRKAWAQAEAQAKEANRVEA